MTTRSGAAASTVSAAASTTAGSTAPKCRSERWAILRKGSACRLLERHDHAQRPGPAPVVERCRHARHFAVGRDVGFPGAAAVADVDPDFARLGGLEVGF